MSSPLPDRDVYEYEPRYWLTADSVVAVAQHLIGNRDRIRVVTASQLHLTRDLKIETEDDAAYLLYVLGKLEIVGPADVEGRHLTLVASRNARKLLNRARATAAVAAQLDSQERFG